MNDTPNNLPDKIESEDDFAAYLVAFMGELSEHSEEVVEAIRQKLKVIMDNDTDDKTREDARNTILSLMFKEDDAD